MLKAVQWTALRWLPSGACISRRRAPETPTAPAQQGHLLPRAQCSERKCDRNPLGLASAAREVAAGRSKETGVAWGPTMASVGLGGLPSASAARARRLGGSAGGSSGPRCRVCVSSRPTAATASPAPQLRLRWPIHTLLAQEMGPARPWAAGRRAAAR